MTRIEIFRAQDGKCFYCQDKLVPGFITRDHFYPVSAVSRHKPPKDRRDYLTDGNMVLCCEACNFEKADRLPTLEEVARFMRLFKQKPRFMSVGFHRDPVLADFTAIGVSHKAVFNGRQ